VSVEATYGLPTPDAAPPEAPEGGYLPSTLAALRDAAISLLPPGRAFSRRLGSMLARVIEALCMEPARVHLLVQTLRRNVSPRRADTEEYVAAWEEAAGIKDASGEISARAQRVAEKIRGRVAFNLQAYEAIASEYGYVLTGPLVSRGGAFRAGHARAGDAVRGSSWSFVFDAPVLGDSSTAQLDALSAAWAARVARAHTIVRARAAGDEDVSVFFIDDEPMYIDADRVVL
jgi:uncharacterized protein YmfQ (DUF2313 family)